jgi:hypothetical protein
MPVYLTNLVKAMRGERKLRKKGKTIIQVCSKYKEKDETL